MNEIKVSLHRNRYKSKPSKDSIDMIKMELAEMNKSIKRDTIKPIAGIIAKEGCTFCPATFNTSFNDPSMSEGNFEQAQLFTLTFCDGVTFEEVREKATHG